MIRRGNGKSSGSGCFKGKASRKCHGFSIAIFDDRRKDMREQSGFTHMLPGLVDLQKAIEHGPVEIVSFPIKNGRSFQFAM